MLKALERILWNELSLRVSWQSQIFDSKKDETNNRVKNLLEFFVAMRQIFKNVFRKPDLKDMQKITRIF